MRATPNNGMDRHLAALMALVINAWAIWALSAAMRPQAPLADAAAALEVVWIKRTAITPPTPATVVATPTHSARTGRDRRAPPPDARAATAATGTANDPAPAPSRPMSAVYLAHARQWARAEAGNFDTTQDPLADRFAPVPGKAADRFRMQPAMTPERAVAMIGGLFGGNDPKEPCRSNRGRIAGLATDGNSAALQRELDFDRRWCRP